MLRSGSVRVDVSPARRSAGLAICSVFCACLFTLPGKTALADPPGPGAESTLSAAITAVLDTDALRTGFQGVLVERVTDRRVLFDRNSAHAFHPASNAKLITSAMALDVLGSSFRYRTRLISRAPRPDTGALRGDVILTGAGDPLLSMADLDEMARSLRRAGVSRIEGRILYDDALFDRLRLGPGWAWDDESDYYSAQCAALNLNENVVELRPQPGGKAGDPVRVVAAPLPAYVEIQVSATVAPAGSAGSLSYRRLPGTNRILVSGSLAVDAPASAYAPALVTIDDPPRYAATGLADALRRAGVSVAGGIAPLAGTSPQPGRGTDRDSVGDAQPVPIAEHVSEPLPEILKRMNLPSDNLIAECLAKTVGAARYGVGTSGPDGTVDRARREWLATRKVEASGIAVLDGSGLSRQDLVTPRALVQLLVTEAGSAHFAEFSGSLPVAGVSGTLRRRMAGTAAANNCRAKTGSFRGCSCLSGYVTDGAGELLAFTILMDNMLAPSSDCRMAQDRIVELLAGYGRPAPSGAKNQ
jgi:D-alanyl-D-alanine carboxypeptidase/D-alanyl-D-alanine-endopeptidase (penicillin-binding protein 4)